MRRIETPTETIIDSIRNITHSIYDLKIVNEFIGGETTRVMNTYCQYIGTNLERENYKAVYDDARAVCDQCGKIGKQVDKLAKLIEQLLNTMKE